MILAIIALFFSFAVAQEPLDTSYLHLIDEPVLIDFQRIKIPVSVGRLGITGKITLQLLINETGNVEKVELVKGLHPVVDSLIINSVKRFVFTPAKYAGEAVPVQIIYEYELTIDDLMKNLKEFINFKGIVLERGTRKPLSDVMVIVNFTDTVSDSTLALPFSLYLKQIGTFSGQECSDNAVITRTDSSGRFNFRSLPEGIASVKIIGSGYQVINSDITISGNNCKTVIYRLNKLSIDGDEIIIYGRKNDSEISRRSLSSHEINRIAGLNGDAIKVVQALPGVSRPVFGTGAIGVRGAPSWDSKYFLDGVPIPQLYHFGGVKSVYNSEALSSVDLYPGGFGVKFGNTIAGAISLNSRDAGRERIRGFVDANLIDVSVFAEGPVNKRTGMLASIRRSYIGDILGVVIKKSDALGIPLTVAPYYYDYLIRADVDIAKHKKLFLTLFGSKDELELITPSYSEGSEEVDDLKDKVAKKDAFNMIMAGYDSKINEKIENHCRISLIQGLGNGLLFGFAKWNYQSWQFLMHNETNMEFSEKISLTAGFDLWLNRYRQTSIFPTIERIFQRDTVRLTSGIVSPFTQIEYKLNPSFAFTTGLRYDYYPELKYRGSVIPEFWNYHNLKNNVGLDGEPSLRFSVKHHLNDRHLLTAAFGSYNQTPQPLGFTTHPEFGDPQFPASKARQMMLGYNWEINEFISADIQLYHNYQWDLPVFSVFNDLIWMNQSDSMITGYGRGRMYGVEILIRKELHKRLSGWISYGLSKSERYNKKQKRYVPYQSDQTHNLQLVINYDFPKRWQAGTRLRLVSGNPYSPVVESVFDGTNRFYQPVYGDENSLRNKPFFQTDLRVEKKFVFDKWLLSAYLDVQNAFCFLYRSPEMTVYNYDFTQKTTIYFPIIPSLGVKAEF